jgi:hypothetical protein
MGLEIGSEQQKAADELFANLFVELRVGLPCRYSHAGNSCQTPHL